MKKNKNEIILEKFVKRISENDREHILKNNSLPPVKLTKKEMEVLHSGYSVGDYAIKALVNAIKRLFS